jgi:hypothetical protein
MSNHLNPQSMKKTRTARTSLLAILAAFLILPLLLFITSCGNNGDNKGAKSYGGGSPTAATDLRINCVILSRAQVQSWVDSGWTKPGSGAIKEILFQFYSANAAASSSNMQLIAYPGETNTNVKITGEQLLAIDTSCESKAFTGKVILANNEVQIDSLKILNPDGTLNDFDYIRFIPTQFSMNPEYVSFKIEKVVKGAVEAKESSGTNPCPPFCCPPNCL